MLNASIGESCVSTKLPYLLHQVSTVSSGFGSGVGSGFGSGVGSGCGSG